MDVLTVSQIKENLKLQKSVGVGDQNVGKDDFLKLMVAQLKYQNPLSPSEDLDFIAQTAQFSSLEQMTNMNSKITELICSSELMYSNSLIGKEINWINEKDEVFSGVVESFEMIDGEPVVVVGNKKVQLDWIFNVQSNPDTESSDSE